MRRRLEARRISCVVQASLYCFSRNYISCTVSNVTCLNLNIVLFVRFVKSEIKSSHDHCTYSKIYVCDQAAKEIFDSIFRGITEPFITNTANTADGSESYEDGRRRICIFITVNCYILVSNIQFCF